MRTQLFIIATAFAASVASALFDKDYAFSDFDVRSLPVNQEVLNSQGKCHECMHRVLFHIITETENAILKKCGHTDCEMVKHVCELARSDPAVVKGYLAGYSDAIGKSYAYCYGEGSCPHPEMSLKVARNADSMVQREMCSYMPDQLLYTVYDSQKAFDEISKDDDTILKQIKSRVVGKGSLVVNSETGLADLAASVDRFPQLSPFDRVGQSSPFVPEPASPFSPYPPSANVQDDDFTTTEKEMDRELVKIVTRHNYYNPCDKCAARVMEKVMLKAIHFVIELCRENQSNPVVARKCSMMQKIPNFSLGYLLSKVEPWKFSAGFCVATHDCFSQKNRNFFDIEREMIKELSTGKSNKGFFRGAYGGPYLKDRFRPDQSQNEVKEKYDEVKEKYGVRFGDEEEYANYHSDRFNGGRKNEPDRFQKNNLGKSFDTARTSYGYEKMNDAMPLVMSHESEAVPAVGL